MPEPDDLTAVLERIASRCYEPSNEGEVASYLPELAEVDPTRFGLAVCTLDGGDHAVGDADVAFPIQSISKVFSLTLAMSKLHDDLWERVGVEPSGDPFNSLVQLEHEEGIPRNPLINAGALVVVDVLLDCFDDPRAASLELLAELADAEIEIDDGIRTGEEGSGHRNRGMAHLMTHFGNITHEVEEVLDVYAHQCATLMTSRQLARAIRFLANDGVDPATGRQVVTDQDARRINAIMLTCGTYDSAGEFAFEVGIPCKSGVAGGIVGDVPDQLGVCAWSPPLDESGNSLGGRLALAQLAEELDLSIF